MDDFFYLDQYKIRIPSWALIKTRYPVIADLALKEYKRIGGFIPYEPGYVYLLHAQGTNYYKIGKSGNPEKRALQISPKMPFQTKPVKVWRSYFMSFAESSLHEEYADERANGEWFELDRDQVCSLLLTCDDSILYAYAKKWGSIFHPPYCSPYSEQHISEAKALYRETRQLSGPDFSVLLDLDILGKQAKLAINLIQFYLDSISKDFAQEIPQYIQEEIKQSYVYAELVNHAAV